MFWRLISHPGACDGNPAPNAKRFVLHRHIDAHGPHLDLRLEQDGYLVGYRIDALSLDEEAWASEKSAHPIDWLARDADAVRLDAGTYQHRIGDETVHLTLYGTGGMHELHLTLDSRITPRTAGAICTALQELGASAGDVPRLIADGMYARRRAAGRLCGLARELDGAAFDEDVCRRSLEQLSLDDIHAQLRAYEVRFDAKYPPMPVSKPEPLPEPGAAQRRDEALAIARG